MLNFGATGHDVNVQYLGALLVIDVLHVGRVEQLAEQADAVDDVAADPRTTPRRSASKRDAIRRTVRLERVPRFGITKPRVMVEEQPAWLVRIELDAEVP